MDLEHFGCFFAVVFKMGKYCFLKNEFQTHYLLENLYVGRQQHRLRAVAWSYYAVCSWAISWC